MDEKLWDPNIYKKIILPMISELNFQYHLDRFKSEEFKNLKYHSRLLHRDLRIRRCLIYNDQELKLSLEDKNKFAALYNDQELNLSLEEKNKFAALYNRLNHLLQQKPYVLNFLSHLPLNTVVSMLPEYTTNTPFKIYTSKGISSMDRRNYVRFRIYLAIEIGSFKFYNIFFDIYEMISEPEPDFNLRKFNITGSTYNYYDEDLCGTIIESCSGLTDQQSFNNETWPDGLFKWRIGDRDPDVFILNKNYKFFTVCF